MKIDTQKAKKLQRLLEAGARNSRIDYGRIQEIHDVACSLGAKCKDGNVPGVMAHMNEGESE